MLNLYGFQPQANKTGALQDGIDRVSPIVGFDINNYVFGNLDSAPMSPNTLTNQGKTLDNGKKRNDALGAVLLLGSAIGACALFFKGKLPKIKLPFSLDSIKSIFSKTP